MSDKNTTIRIFELAQIPVEGNFDLAHLYEIHAYLFQDAYEWAGGITSVDIIRGDRRFSNMRQTKSYSNTVFSALSSENYLISLQPKAFVNRPEFRGGPLG